MFPCDVHDRVNRGCGHRDVSYSYMLLLLSFTELNYLLAKVLAEEAATLA
jgi:hypothetical protein